MADGEEQEQRKARRAHPMLNRRKRWTVGFWVFLFNFVLAILVLYTILSLTETPLGAPRWVTNQVEAETNEALPSGVISIGQMGLQVNEAGLPTVRIVNIGIFDERAVEVARVNQASVRVSALDAFRGQLRPQEIALAGAQITLRRQRDGTFDLSFGSAGGTSGSVTDLLDGFDAAIEQPFLSNLREITARDLTIALEDARSGRVWQITDGSMIVRRLDGGLDISLDFAVFNGTEDLAKVQLGLVTNRRDAGAVLQARFVDAAARDIAVQSPVLSFLGVLDAPISGALRTEFTPEGAVADVDGTLEIGTGALQPNASARPLPFEAARAYFDYDPDAQRIGFRELSVTAPDLTATATGQAYLQEFQNGWPSALVAQIQLTSAAVRPHELGAGPVSVDGGAVDFRLRLDPFEVDVGQVALVVSDTTVSASGRVLADQTGWHVAADGAVERLSVADLLSVWPQGVMGRTRLWIAQNILRGDFHNLQWALRTGKNERPVFEMGFGFRNTELRVMKDYPLLTGAVGYGNFRAGAATFVVEAGAIQAPAGQTVSLAGSSFRIPDLSVRPQQAELNLFASGRALDVVSLLSLPPINALRGSALEPDFLRGDAVLSGTVTYPMTPDRKPEELRFDMRAEITDAVSDVLIPDRVLRMANVEVLARNGFVSASGPFQLGAVTGVASWQNPANPETQDGSVVRGRVELSQAFIDEFQIGLPPGTLNGSGQADFEVRLANGQAPQFELASDLIGVGLSVPQISWSKAPQTPGELAVVGLLGARPEVTSLKAGGPGLSLSDGRVTLREGGGLERASFDTVVAGDWYRGRLAFEGRGPGLAPRLVVRGERLDLAGANFGSGGGGSGGPAEVALGRFQVTQSIALTDVAAALDLSEGVAGTFNGRINGGARVDGRLETVRNGVAVRLQSSEGGEVIRDAGIFPSAKGGALSLVLQPLPDDAGFRGNLSLKDTNVSRAPVLTELLSALSIVGLLDQMRGAGIVFSDVAADFVLAGDEVRLLSSSAVGPSMGISLDGRYDANSGQLDMQGVLSPVYFLNSIGRIVSAREGEGLFGFTFFLTGPSDTPSIRVNPLSALTPGILRDIFRRQDSGG